MESPDLRFLSQVIRSTCVRRRKNFSLKQFVHSLRKLTLAVLLVSSSNYATAQLLINEIDYDQPGTDVAEFIELVNNSGDVVNLGGYSLDLINGNNTTSYQTISLGAGDLADGDYFVVCSDMATVANCDLEAINSVQNGAPDAVALLSGAAIIDTVSYEGDTAAPYTEGSGVGLSDESGGGVGGINDFKSISRTPNATDTDQNNIDFAFTCMSPGQDNLSTTTGCQPADVIALVINEIDYQETGVSNNEFIELYNSGNTMINIDTYSIALIDGATATEYQAVDLPNVTLNAGDYYVVCANAAVSNCDLVTALGDDFIQNGSPDAVALLDGVTVVDTISYDGDTASPYTEGSGVGLIDDAALEIAGLSRFPNGADTDQNNIDFSVRCSTPGAPNSGLVSDCTGGDAVEIFAIQGNGLTSPLSGQIVNTADNIVTGVASSGFFMQTPDARSDGDPDTSDGIWVFTDTPPNVAVGDAVDVGGTVGEFFDLTNITNSPLVTVTSSGNALPSIVVLDSNTPSPLQPQSAIELERFEGMRVSTSGITTGPSDQFGDVPMTAQLMRSFREPGISFPGISGLPVWDGNPEIFEIDPDGLSLADQLIFGGQSLDAEGVLSFSFGDYVIWPTSLSLGTPPTLPRAVRARNTGEFTIATQNVLRLFDNIDDPIADDPIIPIAEYMIRLEKLSYQIRVNLGAPDIVAIQEIESLSVLQALADQIASDQPGLLYEAHLIEGNDVGGIDVAYLTMQDTIAVSSVTQFGADAILTFDGSLLNDRPPLVMDADFIGNGEPFPIKIINIHQRSLGGIEGSSATRVKTKRLEQSQTLAQFIQDAQTANPDVRLIVTGDFNAYEFTDGYVDVSGQISGLLDPLGDEFPTTDIVNPDLTNQTFSLPSEERYSFVFQGSAQALDHTMTSEKLDDFVRGFEFARSNADSPSGLFLATGTSSPPIANATALRSSDHDGGVLFLMSDADRDMAPDDSDNCTLVANADQLDTNNDGFGNICDPDLNNDVIVNFLDLQLLATAFFSTPGAPNWNPDADFNGDMVVNFLDLFVFQNFFLLAPGPSGLAP